MYFHLSFKLATVHGPRLDLEVVPLAVERRAPERREGEEEDSSVFGVVLKTGSGRSTVVVRLGPQPARAKPNTKASKGLYFTNKLPQSTQLQLIRWPGDPAMLGGGVLPHPVMSIIGHFGVDRQGKILFPAVAGCGGLAGELRP